jgi:hypothetical protein
MGWFTKMCRNVGLMVHNVRRPDHERKVIRRDVEQTTQGNVTLRRTTIDEIELNRRDEDKDD